MHTWPDIHTSTCSKSLLCCISFIFFFFLQTQLNLDSHVTVFFFKLDICVDVVLSYYQPNYLAVMLSSAHSSSTLQRCSMH